MSSKLPSHNVLCSLFYAYVTNLVPPGGRLLDSTTMVLPGLVVGGVVLGLGHVAPELEIDLKPSDG